MMEMGDLQPHSRFIQLFTNGVYMGQFELKERLTDAFLAEYLGGPRENYLTVKGNDNSGTYGWIPGVADGPDRSAWDNARSNRFAYTAVKDAVDLTNYIDFMLSWEWGNAESEYRAAMARTPGGSGGFKLWMADADGHLRQQSGASGQLTKDAVTGAQTGNAVFTNGPGYIFSALLTENNADFKTLLADRIYKHFFNGGALTPTSCDARLLSIITQMTNSIVAECARWGGTVSRTPENWASDAQYARNNILPARANTLFSQMRTAKWYPSFDPPTLSQYASIAATGSYWRLLGISTLTALGIGCSAVLLAYPLAYFLAFRAGARAGLYLILLLIPFWTSYLLRIMAWKILLGTEGVINSFLIYIGFIQEPLTALLYNRTAVLLTLIYVWIPFAILPILAALQRIDLVLFEAASDLGARPFHQFMRITLPLSAPGTDSNAINAPGTSNSNGICRRCAKSAEKPNRG